MFNEFFDKNKPFIVFSGFVLAILSFLLNIPKPEQRQAIVALSYLNFLLFFLLCILLLIIFLRFYSLISRFAWGSSDKNNFSLVKVLIANILVLYGFRIIQNLWTVIHSLYEDTFFMFLQDFVFSFFFIFSLCLVLGIVFILIIIFRKYMARKWGRLLDILFLAAALYFSIFLFVTLSLSFSMQPLKFSLAPIRSILKSTSGYFSLTSPQTLVATSFFVLAVYSSQRDRLVHISKGGQFVLIDYKEKKVLLQKRTKDAPSYPNYWGLFGGGAEQKDKTPEETVKREAKEELGIKMNFKLFAEYSRSFIYFAPLTLPINELKKRQKEGQDLGLFNYKEVEGLKMTNYAKNILKDLFKKHIQNFNGEV